MREALRLAEQGRYAAWPNPTVGAVLVRDGLCVARGWHHAAGLDHAEVDCLKDAAARNVPTEGATLVVTLEPCNHYGKTPPCSKAILEAGIARVVMGAADVNPRASGGAAALRAAGVEVVEGVLERECLDLTADFRLGLTGQGPYVLLKMAVSLDNRIDGRVDDNGAPLQISSPESRALVHQWRAGIGRCGGAVLVGGNTFRADNPRLTARGEGAGPQPLACVLTARLPEAEENFHLLAERPEQTIFFTTADAAASGRAERLRRKGARVLDYGCRDILSNILAQLRELGCPYVLCEGGGKLALSLLQAGLADEFRLHLASVILGQAGATPLFPDFFPAGTGNALSLRLCDTSICGNDAHLVFRPR
ncbi:MAG: bifunctional diaminohydroxyphosphoribosylaminopyrimidine deaminase/5-amino-6-(5-phosphoribosylamino)uracil reductase RibD [Desulfovibrio sp.]|jgi:diaminohydroxyphosphoribosylaminopyrimidine deaminase/5-amino-6-(5-phosphoribosylamino)uracil reductase|nr:bifunctional diaminohydroxyphosphoribosylaminopyrimidine deaminase/5-amino-6-(5-phosphoribosylamino)uracil reductase RibD [Desulfovibrio sp.]